MSQLPTLSSAQEYHEQHFQHLQQPELNLQQTIFNQCTFSECQWPFAIFEHCQFIDCEFKQCNLSNLRCPQTRFDNVHFKESKLNGINWTQAYWPHIALQCPLVFSECLLNDSSFYALSLRELCLQSCKAQHVGFRETDLSHALFILSDLAGSLFQHCDLSHCDFSDAYHYTINPLENKLEHAKFTLPDALALLEAFNIEINA